MKIHVRSNSVAQLCQSIQSSQENIIILSRLKKYKNLIHKILQIIKKKIFFLKLFTIAFLIGTTSFGKTAIALSSASCVSSKSLNPACATKLNGCDVSLRPLTEIVLEISI